MKTTFPKEIKTLEEFTDFMKRLRTNGEDYDPTLNSYAVLWRYKEPTDEEKDKLNELMAQGLKIVIEQNFDLYDFLLQIEEL